MFPVRLAVSLLATLLVGSGDSAPVLISLPACTAADCQLATKLLYEYANDASDGDDVQSVRGQGNTWRLYDTDDRALDRHDVAALIRAALGEKPVRRVMLDISWAAGPPRGYENWGPTLASVGALLEAPATAPNGFLWFGPSGAKKVTHQDFTALYAPYRARPGEFVMASAAFAATSEEIEAAATSRDAKEVFFVARSEDVFGLHPDSALQFYERCAELGEALCAYNAAMIRFQRNWIGDDEAAAELLIKAREFGDPKADALLARVRAGQR